MRVRRPGWGGDAAVIYIDAGYAAALSVLGAYAVVLWHRRRQLVRRATRARRAGP
jgi:hypothetical protein